MGKNKRQVIVARENDDEIAAIAVGETGRLDRIDINILDRLQEDGRLTNVRLAELVGLSPSPCLRRVKLLEDQGYIEGYHATLNARRAGFGVTVFVHISIRQHIGKEANQFREAIKRVPEIIECHAISGGTDFLLMVISSSLDAYSELNKSVLLRLPNVSKIESAFSLDVVKKTHRLPLERLSVSEANSQP